VTARPSESRAKSIDLGLCRKCGSAMALGVAIRNTWTGTGDFGKNDVVTVSPGGPGKLVACSKCTACGWSVSGTEPVAIEGATT
jgi:hypothetical protein